MEDRGQNGRKNPDIAQDRGRQSSRGNPDGQSDQNSLSGRGKERSTPGGCVEENSGTPGSRSDGNSGTGARRFFPRWLSVACLPFPRSACACIFIPTRAAD